MSDLPKLAPASDGWHYTGSPAEGTDARKLVTLRDGTMTWVGIRVWNARHGRWENNGEPEPHVVCAWRDLFEPARGYWSRGQFVLPSRRSFDAKELGVTLKQEPEPPKAPGPRKTHYFD